MTTLTLKTILEARDSLYGLLADPPKRPYLFFSPVIPADQGFYGPVVDKIIQQHVSDFDPTHDKGFLLPAEWLQIMDQNK